MNRLTRPCENMENNVNRLYYEDLEKQGRLVILPCKIGSTIYQVCYKCICTLGHANLHSTCNSPIECTKCRAVKIKYWIRETTFDLSLLDRIGVDFFVTREEAEAEISINSI